MNDGSRPLAALALLRESDSDCPVCGLGGAFANPWGYDTCGRCGWVDDPDDDGLSAAQHSWPERSVSRIAGGPASRFEVVPCDDEVGGFEYRVDGVVVRDLFPGRGWNLKAAIGPWPARGDWSEPLRTGRPVTPTGRSRLYVCPLCGGDDSEASLTADVRIVGDRVVWSRIGLETYVYETESWGLDARRGPAGFAFDADEYRRALGG